MSKIKEMVKFLCTTAMQRYFDGKKFTEKDLPENGQLIVSAADLIELEDGTIIEVIAQTSITYYPTKDWYKPKQGGFMKVNK